MRSEDPERTESWDNSKAEEPPLEEDLLFSVRGCDGGCDDGGASCAVQQHK